MCVFLIEQEFTLGNIIGFFLKVRADSLLCSYSSHFWDDVERQRAHKITCVRARVWGYVGSCATDWYHKWTMGWKIPQCQMKGRINRRGVELRWALRVHRGRSDEEIIEKGPLPSQRSRQESRAYEMQKSCRRLNDQFQRVGSFPSQASNPPKRKKKSNLDGEERY